MRSKTSLPTLFAKLLPRLSAEVCEAAGQAEKSARRGPPLPRGRVADSSPKNNQKGDL